jgi:diguanylate cyclase (GGDEF)-like protein
VWPGARALERSSFQPPRLAEGVMNQKILIIDDSSDIHHLLKVRLRSEGLELQHALDAEDGLSMARELLPDLILLDVDLPDVTGFEVCRTLKSDARTRSIPVIFLTGAVSVYNQVEGFELGAVDYVTKPFDHAELKARVRSALRTKRYQDLLSERAQIDGLTGLWNRAHFDRCLRNELQRPRKPGDTTPVALLMLDIDHFKHINDTYGHPFGDRVIACVAEAIASSVRGADIACRYGGEEFGLILPGATIDSAADVGARIQRRIADMKLVASGTPVAVTVSIGAGVAPPAADVDAFLKSVDDAQYTAKRTGRDRVSRAA